MRVVALVLLMFSLQVQAKKIVISDIDDTLKRTNVLGFLLGGTRTTNPFIGLPELLMAYQCHEEVNKSSCLELRAATHSTKRWVNYVTAAKGRLQMFGREFIARSNFPFGYVKGKDQGEATLTFKTREISKIISANSDAEIFLIGDNGQDDVPAYKNVTNMYPFKKITSFIHYVYSTQDEDKDRRGVALMPGQIPYLTSVDLGLEFLKRDLISSDDLLKIAKKVDYYISSNNDDLYEQVIPDWVKCGEFVRDYKRPNVVLSGELERLVSKIEARVNSMCRYRFN